jgi:hypothetical protein
VPIYQLKTFALFARGEKIAKGQGRSDGYRLMIALEVRR